MKTTILKISVFALFFSLMGAGCEKEEPSMKKANGLVLYYGNPAVDGCGWMIKIDSIEYSPTNLDSMFQQDSLKVILDYDTLNSTWNCGWREPGYQQIQIIEIGLEN
jgi:hypothetical protein